MPVTVQKGDLSFSGRTQQYTNLLNDFYVQHQARINLPSDRFLMYFTRSFFMEAINNPPDEQRKTLWSVKLSECTGNEIEWYDLMEYLFDYMLELKDLKAMLSQPDEFFRVFDKYRDRWDKIKGDNKSDAMLATTAVPVITPIALKETVACPSCQTEIPNNVKFCGHCGAKVIMAQS